MGLSPSISTKKFFFSCFRNQFIKTRKPLTNHNVRLILNETMSCSFQMASTAINYNRNYSTIVLETKPRYNTHSIYVGSICMFRKPQAQTSTPIQFSLNHFHQPYHVFPGPNSSTTFRIRFLFNSSGSLHNVKHRSKKYPVLLR